MRLDKFLCDTVFCTRNEAKALIKKGQVSVNGAVIKDTGFAVSENTDKVICSGKEISYKEFYYYALNKPAGYVVSDDERDGTPVKLLLPEEYRERLKPVGRLDKDTTGLLLFTDDGALSHELLSPKKHVDKTYFVSCEKEVTEEDLESLRNGISLGDGEVSAPAKVMYAESGSLKEIYLTIHEGKFHQVKRMLSATCNKVLTLKRVSFANLELKELDIREGEGKFIEKNQI